MATRVPASDDTGSLRTPAPDDTGTLVVAAARSSRSAVATLGELFTQPLAGHVSRFREPARTLLTAVAGLMTLGVLLVPSGAAFRTPVVLGGLVAGLALLGMSVVPRLQPFLNRSSGLLLIVNAHVLVAGTGGFSSPLRQVYLLLLVYFAAFYGTQRLVATASLAGLSLVATELGPHAGDAASTPTDLVTGLVAWLTIVVTVHVLVQRLRSSAHTDPLTGLVDHGTFWDAVALEQARADRDDSCYSVLLIDLDHFKSVNDTHGHQMGDAILRGVGELLSRRTRRVDVAARYGGEELAVVLSATGSVGARTAAEKVRRRIGQLRAGVPVTASVGVATYRAGDPRGPAEVVRAADEALYRAKRAGRDRVAVAPLVGSP